MKEYELDQAKETASSRYYRPDPVDIVEYLCQHSANGYSEEAVAAKEQELDVSFPNILRTYLLRVGRECISTRRVEVFYLPEIQREGDYLILGVTKWGTISIRSDTAYQDDPVVLVRKESEDWQPFRKRLSIYLLQELYQRIGQAEHDDYTRQTWRILRPERYFCCKHLKIKELTDLLNPTEIPDTDQEEWEQDNEEISEGVMRVGSVEYKCCDGWLVLPEELLSILRGNIRPIPYLPRFCIDLDTDTLYCAMLEKDGRFKRLLQINSQPTTELYHYVKVKRLGYVEKLFSVLIREVHDPVMSYCIQRCSTLPESIMYLAYEELHDFAADAIGRFLELFEKKVPWKLGIIDSNSFMQCSRISSRASLHDLWWGCHLREASELWTPSLVKDDSEGNPALEQMEPFVQELVYRVHKYNLLNRYTFLARKLVSGTYSQRTEDLCDQERFQFLSFYREIVDCVMERLFDCLELQLFTIQVEGQDFVKLCPRPTAQLSSWLRWYRSKELDFLDNGSWP